MVVVFTEGELEYPELGLDKPVRYSEDFLKELFVDAERVPLTVEHSKEVVAELSSFKVDDGKVFVDLPETVDVNGLGFSPSFIMDFKECDGFYEPVNARLESIGLTKTPRNKIIYNSVERSDNMSDKALETALKRQRELETERAALENQLNSQKTALKKLNSLEKQIKELSSKNEELSSQVEEYTPKVEMYDKYVANKREELLETISNGSEEIKNKFKEFSYDNLKTIAEQRLVNTPPKGVSTNSSEGANALELDVDKGYTSDDFKADYMKAYNREPNFTF